MPLINSSETYRSCRVDKCGAFGTLFLGATPDENILGLTLAVSLPFIYLAFRGRARVLMLLCVTVMVLFTGSRTSIYGALAFFVVLGLLGWRGTRAKGRAAAGLAFAAISIVSLVLPYWHNYDPTAYSLRGILWTVARQRMPHAATFGWGSNGWAELYHSQHLIGTPSYGPHNLFMLVRFASGWVGLAVFCLALLGLLRRAGAGRLGEALLVLTPVIACGVLEQPWAVFSLDWGTPAMIAALVAIPKAHSVTDLPAPTLHIRPAAKQPLRKS